MINKFQIFRCSHCGNIVEIVHGSGPIPVCCNVAMDALKDKTAEQEGNEKHCPVVTKTANGIKVEVGSICHPMDEKHFIEFIEVRSKDSVQRKYLQPKDKPEAYFDITGDDFEVREYCTVHGLWLN